MLQISEVRALRERHLEPCWSLADDGPVYSRPIERPADQDSLAQQALPAYPAASKDLLLRMVASPNLCSRRWVVEQYDRVVMGDSRR